MVREPDMQGGILISNHGLGLVSRKIMCVRTRDEALGNDPIISLGSVFRITRRPIQEYLSMVCALPRTRVLILLKSVIV